jgi:hypothetical protein
MVVKGVKKVYAQINFPLFYSFFGWFFVFFLC